MLVLSRKVDEEIVIDHTIRIKVLRVQKDRILLEINGSEDDGIFERFFDQRFFVAPWVQVIIVDVRPHVRKVRLGFIAPKEIPIHRLEIERRQKEGQNFVKTMV